MGVIKPLVFIVLAIIIIFFHCLRGLVNIYWDKPYGMRNAIIVLSALILMIIFYKVTEFYGL